jgi:hypothetical protein
MHDRDSERIYDVLVFPKRVKLVKRCAKSSANSFRILSHPLKVSRGSIVSVLSTVDILKSVKILGHNSWLPIDMISLLNQLRDSASVRTVLGLGDSTPTNVPSLSINELLGDGDRLALGLRVPVVVVRTLGVETIGGGGCFPGKVARKRLILNSA